MLLGLNHYGKNMRYYGIYYNPKLNIIGEGKKLSSGSFMISYESTCLIFPNFKSCKDYGFKKIGK